MPKQSLTRRIQNALVANNPRERWAKIQEDLPVECGELVKALGPIPVATLDDIPIEKAVYYSGRDADATCRVDTHFNRILKEARSLEQTVLSSDAHSKNNGTTNQVEGIDLAVIPYYERMQANGICADRKHFEDFGTLLDLEREQLGQEINRVTGRDLNPGSGDQCADYLFHKLRLKPVDPETGKVLKPRLTKSRKRQSTDEKSLQALRTQHPIVPLIVDWREMQKLKSTYVDGLVPWIGSDSRIHSRFSLTSSPNGQTAAYDPNLLAIPVATEWGKEIRRGFVAPEGCTLATFDLDQWFMRILAHLSGDQNMISVFHSGEDIHVATARHMFKIPKHLPVDKEKHRGPAKRTGFGICNGITGVGLSAQYDLNQERGTARRSVEDCDGDIESWLDVYHFVREFQKREIYNCRRRGFTEDLFGRIRYLPNIHSSIEQLRAEAERQSFTHVIQSTAHCVKKMMIAKIWEWLKWFWEEFYRYRRPLYRLEPVLEVHDELLYENTDEPWLKTLMSEEIKTRMETAYPLAVPIGVHVAFAPNWAALQELK